MKETAKSILGSSTRALENARADALSRNFQCGPQECFDAVVSFVSRESKIQEELARKALQAETTTSRTTIESNETLTSTPISSLKIFIKDTRRQLLVLMGIPGSVDTTEVGVFFSSIDGGGTKVDISSLSREAKARAADLVFPELSKSYNVLTPAVLPEKVQ